MWYKDGACGTVPIDVWYLWYMASTCGTGASRCLVLVVQCWYYMYHSCTTSTSTSHLLVLYYMYQVCITFTRHQLALYHMHQPCTTCTNPVPQVPDMCPCPVPHVLAIYHMYWNPLAHLLGCLCLLQHEGFYHRERTWPIHMSLSLFSTCVVCGVVTRNI